MQDERIRNLLQSSVGAGTLKVGFLLVENFSMLAFASAIEPLRAANRMAETQLFDWVVAGAAGEAVRASNGITVMPEGGLEALAARRLVFVCSGLDVQKYTDKGLLNLVRRLDRGGAITGAICTGTYIMAAAGLLDNRSCTIHWENIDGLAEEFPLLEVTSELFEIDDTRITCSGGTAALDMMLYLIGQAHGQALAAKVSEQFIHDRIRDPSGPPAYGIAFAPWCVASQIAGCCGPYGIAFGRTSVTDPAGQHGWLVNTAAGKAVPQISAHHADAILSQSAAGSRTPPAAANIHVHPVHSLGVRFCFRLAFFQMLPGNLWAHTAR